VTLDQSPSAGEAGPVHLSYISVTLGILIAVTCAWYCRRLAADKRRSVPLWTLLGFVLTVVAVPVLVLLPEARREGDARRGEEARGTADARAAATEDVPEGDGEGGGA